MKALQKNVFKIMVIVGMVLFCSLKAEATEDRYDEVAQLSQFMITTEEVEAKRLPEEGAETAFTYEAGATIYVTGETEDGWYIVSFQGKTGYVSKELSTVSLQKAEIDVEGLDAEMELEQEESKLIVEETERQRAEARRSKIWGTVIVLLVIGIFATGIISTIQAEKQEKKAREDELINLNKKKESSETTVEEEKQLENQEDEIWDLDKE